MPYASIKSIKDEKIVFARGLQQRKTRVATKCLLVEGVEQIKWAQKSPLELQYLLAHDKGQIEGLSQFGAPVFTCSEGILKKVTGTNYLVPVIAVASFEVAAGRGSELQVVLDGVQDFGNIGTIVRTAAAFGIDQFVATSPEFDLYQRKSIDASRGTVFSAHCRNYGSAKDAVTALKEQGYQVVATALEGATIQSLAQLEKRPVAIVFGNETTGVSAEILEQADLRIQIPMATQLDSLNVGVAAGISLYELKLKMVMLMLNEKIKGSLGRNLTSCSSQLRQAFNVKLQDVCELNAEQAIILMILACDESGEKQTLIQMAGANSPESHIFNSLISQGYLLEDGSAVQMTEKGRELLAKLWNIHELVENIALEGFSKEEKEQFEHFLQRVYQNLAP